MVEEKIGWERREDRMGGLWATSNSQNLPVYRLHLSGYADNSTWQEVVELLKQLSDVGLILQVKVQLNDPQDLWRSKFLKRVVRVDVAPFLSSSSSGS